jgi:hypothetical protein
MEHFGSEYTVILNDPQLREGLIRDAHRSRRSGRRANRSHVLRVWFAHVLHGLASRVDPAAGSLRPSFSASRVDAQ